MYAKRAFDRWPQARRYRDFREMLQAEGSKIDAVYCGTPDHTHAVITLAALRQKKHVCCVKPLTRTIQECRLVVKTARQAGVATQVTASPNTSEDACRTCELIWAGAIGAVREVHIWSNRPIWPQGMDRPAGEDPMPKTLGLGSVDRPRPDAAVQERLAERIAGVEAGVAILQGRLPSFQLPRLVGFRHRRPGRHGLPSPEHAVPRLETQASQQRLCLLDQVPEGDCAVGLHRHLRFPGPRGMPPVRVAWYDGGLKPAYSAELEGKPLPAEGTLYVGEEGKMLGPTIVSAARAKKFADVPRTLPRRPGTWGEWYEACPAGSPPVATSTGPAR